jgi:hypothetical protein
MGCDMHAHVELKIAGHWHHYHACSIVRRYQAFGELAGVRCVSDSPPVARALSDSNEELPDDLTTVTSLSVDSWEADGHTWGVINAKEFGDWRERVTSKFTDGNKWESNHWFEEGFGYLFGNTYDGWAKHPEHRNGAESAVEDIRIVFWFDN